MRVLPAFALAALAIALPLSLRAEDAEPDKKPDDAKPVAKSPEEAWAQFQQAIVKKDKERIWALLSKGSRESLEKELGAKLKSAEERERAEMAAELGIPLEDYAKMSEKDLVLAMVIKAAGESGNDLLKLKVKDIKVDGEKAEGKREASADEKDKETTQAYFLREDGEWKLDIRREMEAATAESPPPDEPPSPDDKK